MSTFLLVVCLLNLALSAVLVWRLLLLKKQANVLQQRQERSAAASPLAPVLYGSRIEVEILNPFALAARETAFAKPAAALAPELIRRIVYDRAAGDIAKELVDRGVEARVSVRRA